jgi:hypothetical protein
MSQAASQAAAFYEEVARTREVWTIRDEGGFPAPLTQTGQRAQPFWSSLSRVETITKRVPAYAGFHAVKISWKEFRDEWLPDFAREGILIGVNWSGSKATGYEVEPESVRRNVEHYLGASDVR